MASVSPINGTAGSGQSSTPSSTGQLAGVTPDENTFLKLLVAQLKNQDPLNPADSTQFVGQLAQFSSLEQLMQISQNTSSLAKAVTPAQTPQGS